jgi:hypothetical protein
VGVRAGTGTGHRYQLCRDEYCDNYICRIYKEGHRDGYEDGHQRGYDEGWLAGYSAGAASASGGR